VRIPSPRVIEVYGCISHVCSSDVVCACVSIRVLTADDDDDDDDGTANALGLSRTD